jgi:hypothetical protein
MFPGFCYHMLPELVVGPEQQATNDVGAYFPLVFVDHTFGPELWEKYNVKRSGYVMGTFSVDFLSDVGESSLHPKPGPVKPGRSWCSAFHQH